MVNCLDIRFDEVVADYEDGPSPYWLRWPSDRYRDLVSGSGEVEYFSAVELKKIAKLDSSYIPDKERLKVQVQWFTAAATGHRSDWPAMPVLTHNGGCLQFIDGRHRCEALYSLDVVRIPVVVA